MLCCTLIPACLSSSTSRAPNHRELWGSGRTQYQWEICMQTLVNNRIVYLQITIQGLWLWLLWYCEQGNILPFLYYYYFRKTVIVYRTHHYMHKIWEKTSLHFLCNHGFVFITVNIVALLLCNLSKEMYFFLLYTIKKLSCFYGVF